MLVRLLTGPLALRLGGPAGAAAYAGGRVWRRRASDGQRGAEGSPAGAEAPASAPGRAPETGVRERPPDVEGTAREERGPHVAR